MEHIILLKSIELNYKMVHIVNKWMSRTGQYWVATVDATGEFGIPHFLQLYMELPDQFCI